MKPTQRLRSACLDKGGASKNEEGSPLSGREAKEKGGARGALQLLISVNDEYIKSMQDRAAGCERSSILSARRVGAWARAV